jgi:hypothetical protein
MTNDGKLNYISVLITKWSYIPIKKTIPFKDQKPFFLFLEKKDSKYLD